MDIRLIGQLFFIDKLEEAALEMKCNIAARIRARIRTLRENLAFRQRGLVVPGPYVLVLLK